MARPARSVTVLDAGASASDARGVHDPSEEELALAREAMVAT